MEGEKEGGKRDSETERINREKQGGREKKEKEKET